MRFTVTLRCLNSIPCFQAELGGGGVAKLAFPPLSWLAPGLIPQAWLIGNDPRMSGEHMVVREIAATPIDVLLVASLGKNGQRNEPRRLIRYLEPTVSKDNVIVLPSSIGLQFVRKL